MFVIIMFACSLALTYYWLVNVAVSVSKEQNAIMSTILLAIGFIAVIAWGGEFLKQLLT